MKKCLQALCIVELTARNRSGYCRKHYMKIYRNENPEIIKRNMDSWHEKNPGRHQMLYRGYNERNKEQRKQKRLDKYWKNPELSREISKKNYQKYKQKSAARNKIWRAENPEILASINRRRRARKRSAPSEKYTVEIILSRYGSKCFLCNRDIDLMASRRAGIGDWQLGLHLDHVIPLSQGGTDLIENIRPTHAFCNMSKHNRIVKLLPPQYHQGHACPTTYARRSDQSQTG